MMSSDEEDDSGHSGGDGMAIQPMNDVQFQGGTNPLLIQNILDKIFDSLPLSCLFKFRRVCKLWNNILVPRINQNGKNSRLLKIVDLGGRGTLIGEDEEEIEEKKVKVIDIKEILVTMEAGRLEFSTCTNIYFDDSMELNPSVFEALLALNGKNIKVLHYDGNKIEELKKILKTCSHNLERLSLWKLSSRGSTTGLYENDEEPKLIFPKLENITFVSGEDGNRWMRMGLNMDYIDFHPTMGRSNPSENFLVGIFEASPNLHSLSCRLYHSRILEALTQTNSYSKLTSLCLKSRVGIPQLRSLISANMRLKNLHLEKLCATIHTPSHDFFLFVEDSLGPPFAGSDDPQLMEFAPLLLELLKSQANTLEYLKLDLFTERSAYYPDIPTDVLLNHFPRMPNLITFVVGNVKAWRTEFPFEISTFAELFPKLRDLESIPVDHRVGDDYYTGIVEFDGVDGNEDFPANYPLSPNASSSLRNFRGLEISHNLAEFFPCITEFHLQWNGGNYRTSGMIHKIPSCLPRLKHFYHAVNITPSEESKVLKLIRILNGFMTGISPEECQETEENRAVRDGFENLSQVQFARSRPSIFDLNDLETLDFKFSCPVVRGARELRILPAIEVLISWGLSRMIHLKKLRFQFEQRMNSENRLPESCGTLLRAFGNRNNLETHSQGYDASGRPKGIRVEKNWNFELNLQHHTSEWDQMKFFREDPDICLDLGLEE